MAKNTKTAGRSSKPSVIIVGADKGGVGKTTISRILLDYLADKNTLARSYDTETPKGSLVRFFPDQTEIIEITTVADQMKVFDSLETSEIKVTVIDLRAGLLSQTLEALKNIGFLEAAANGEFSLTLIHVLGPSIASLSEIADITDYLEGNQYILARNFINETDFFEWDTKTYQHYFDKVKDVADLRIPKLHEMAYEQVDIAGVPFSQFIENLNGDGSKADFSFVLRGYVRKWLQESYAELDRIEFLKVLQS